jgi:uncharacterized protein (TIGR03792 family)
MVIEWLKIRVNPETREKFVELDQEIWTKVLARQSGFLGKEVWINPAVSDEIIVVVHWQTREQWKAIAPDLLAKTEEAFKVIMGTDTYAIIEAQEYQIRKCLSNSIPKD